MTTGSGAENKPPDATASASEPYRELIESALSQGHNAMSIWQELADRHSFTGAYESVKRYARKLRGTQSLEREPSFRRHRAKSLESITAPALWSATHRPASPGARVCSC